MKKRVIRDNACYEIDLECLKKKKNIQQMKDNVKRDNCTRGDNRKGT